MGEWKREMDVLKEQCKDPAMRANWIGIGLLLGFLALGSLFLLICF